MASSLHLIIFFCSFLIISSCATARTSFRPRALVFPVTKDASSLQYLTTINQGTPLVPFTVTLNLGGRYLWLDCENGNVSSTKRVARCPSAQCSLSEIGFCISDKTCSIFPYNPVNLTSGEGRVASDVVSVQSTDGKNPGRNAHISQFLFICARAGLLGSLASGVKGMAGLGRSKISLPSQFSAAFSSKRRFALCLSPSTRSKGVLFFGDGPYEFLPGFDASTSLEYTPLNTDRTTWLGIDEPSGEYFIGVRSIKINEKVIPLEIIPKPIADTKDYYGAIISTVNPYTELETYIYNTVVDAFVKELSHVERVAPVAPFGACFNAKNISSTRLGPAVPTIDLVMQSKKVWRIYGANSMVWVSDKVQCLGFVDGGDYGRYSIIIGGLQIEDHLLQFDLARSRLGFSSSLLARQTTCANFNFTSTA